MSGTDQCSDMVEVASNGCMWTRDREPWWTREIETHADVVDCGDPIPKARVDQRRGSERPHSEGDGGDDNVEPARGLEIENRGGLER